MRVVVAMTAMLFIIGCDRGKKSKSAGQGLDAIQKSEVLLYSIESIRIGDSAVKESSLEFLDDGDMKDYEWGDALRNYDVVTLNLIDETEDSEKEQGGRK